MIIIITIIITIIMINLQLSLKSEESLLKFLFLYMFVRLIEKKKKGIWKRGNQKNEELFKNVSTPTIRP